MSLRVDIDDELSAEVMNPMGTTSADETVNEALEDYVAQAKRDATVDFSQG
jgi:Arc/MetJ family transcription regulator